MKKMVSLLSALAVSVLLVACGKSDMASDSRMDGNPKTKQDGSTNLDKIQTTEKLSQYTVGDIVTMGSYEQDNNEDNGAEPIEWIVLDTDGEKTLLLSKYVLTEDFYDLSDNEQINWYTSDIYWWLNSDFINSAFSEEERKQIVNSEYGNVFLLSFDEAVKYFEMTPVQETNPVQNCEYLCYYSQNALGVPTQTVIENSIDDKELTQERYDELTKEGIIYDTSVIGNTYIPYWLRTPVEGDLSCANAISDQGGLLDKGVSSIALLLKATNGVRPAMWVDASSKEIIDNIDDVKENEVSTSSVDSNATDVSRFYGYDLPLIYVFDYTEQKDGSWKFDIEDCGDYFIVAGRFECPECVAVDSADGYFTTGSGHGYEVTGREAYNNDQREKILLRGDDGVEYQIMNVPASYMDAYTNASYYVIATDENTFVTFLENVKLKIDADTIVLNDMTFREYYDSGIFDRFPFESCYTNYAFDIHFTEDGKIDIFNGAEIGSNGNWYSGDGVEYWTESIE